MATGAVHLRATMAFGAHVTIQSITHLSFHYENRNRSQSTCYCSVMVPSRNRSRQFPITPDRSDFRKVSQLFATTGGHSRNAVLQAELQRGQHPNHRLDY